MKRASGVLMHISSLFGNYSIGSFGEEAKKFAFFLKKCGFSYWQVLPFCMPDENNSPYKSYSAFGVNPYFIDLPTLFEEGLLTSEELEASRQYTPYSCEFDRLAGERIELLRKACSRLTDGAKKEIKKFISEQPMQLEACRFLALKSQNEGQAWHDWKIQKPDEDEVFFWSFVQYKFFSQWQDVKEYANSLGIKIIGDIPIYVSLDSCDVWAHKELFQLDEKGYPTRVAGVPPDYFSEDGQMWGNPLYDWEKMKKDGYSWWQSRMEYMFTLFDGVRIDHFRGLESYYSIPADAKTAREGEWVKGPSHDFIDKLKEISRGKLIIAEDLGDITPEVNELLEYSAFPGMRVFQFGFLGDRESPHLVHNFNKNCIAYTGTHDNNTTLGFLWECDEVTRNEIIDYISGDRNDWSSCCERIVRYMLASHADTVIIPIQDIFVFGADTRMNTPGTTKNNWQYRITEDQLYRVDTEKFRHYNYLYGRIQ